LLREGAAVGLRAVFTGDRSGLGGQVSTVFDDRLILRMSDPNDYNYAGINERHVPSDMPSGRVLEMMGAGGISLRESQVALLDADDSGTAQVAALQVLARACGHSYGQAEDPQRPLHVDELPLHVTYSQVLRLDPGFTPPSPLWALVGAGGDELRAVGVDLLTEGPGFTIAGPPRSGRSTTLMTMVKSLLDPSVGEGAVPVALVSPRRSPLRTLEGSSGVLGVLGPQADRDDLQKIIESQERYVVVVDDAELLDGTELDDALLEVLRQARDGEHAVIIAGTTDDLVRSYSGFTAESKRSRSGVLLNIHAADDGDVLGVRLPRNTEFNGPIGRALVVKLGDTTLTQTALPS
jgi:S-DNA-T family DNA segregation ATPase FtsK/SpoIIIE